ncbi:hypothetical protein [Pararhizobium sp.]|uniref:hypothetical protein n=1 Tax=Pararhizobium sp. TaxID=1977563 RepID=UPI00271D0B11|nr:hypothetical protein [Pararhizobium sp.]MDO9417961.1 hypothetical protein [Pararhizobium sp.]
MTEPASRADPALQAIFDLVEHLMGDRRIREESRVLLRDALNASIASGFEISFYQALGLRTWGGASPVRRMQLGRRNRRLCELRDDIPEWAAMTPATAAKAMAASALRYQTDRWPRERDQLSAPSAEPAATWWRVLRSGEAIPGEKRLAQIFRQEIQDDV